MSSRRDEMASRTVVWRFLLYSIQPSFNITHPLMPGGFSLEPFGVR